MTCPASQAVGVPAGRGASDLLPILQALADPGRLRIVLMLREREQCVCHLTEALGLSQGTVSHHMGVLKRVGLVVDRRDDSDARWVYYRLAPPATEVGRRLADLLDAARADPTPADCAGRKKGIRRSMHAPRDCETAVPEATGTAQGGI